MFVNFASGISYLFKGLSLITEKGIRPFVVIPLLINIGVFSLAIWIANSQFTLLMNQLLGWLPSWLSWVEWLLWPLFALLIFTAIYYVFTLIANLIASPFNALLSERVEQHLNGIPLPPFKGYAAMVKLIGKTIVSEFQKIIYMLKWLLPLIVLSFIPVLNLASPFAWALFGAWMMALQYTDYPMGNHELFIKDELILLRQHRLSALGFGAMVTVMTLIPFINFFAMPAAVAGGTAFWVDKLSKT